MGGGMKAGLVAALVCLGATTAVVVGVQVADPQAPRTAPTASPDPSQSPGLRPEQTPSASPTPTPPGPQPTGAPDPQAEADLDRIVPGMQRALDRQPVAPVPSPTSRSARDTDGTFVLSSFNVLGSSHTGRRGNKQGWDPGTTRVRRVAELLDRHAVDVVGFQELQGNQLRTLDAVTEGRLGFYPGFALGAPHMQDSIAWRKDSFELLRADTIEIPYFNGRRRRMPVVLLRHRASGSAAFFANFHNPASTRRVGDQQGWRDVATARQVHLAARLMRETGLPVFVTGDMNETREYFCRMTGEAAMVAAQGGSNGRVCRPPKVMGVDWIFGSASVEFDGYTVDRGALVRRTTDHPMVLTRVRLGD